MRAGRHLVMLKGSPRNDGNTARRASLRLTNDWSLGWSRARNISREFELALHFPAEQWLNRCKPAAHSGWLEIRVLPPPKTRPWSVTTLEVLSDLGSSISLVASSSQRAQNIKPNRIRGRVLPTENPVPARDITCPISVVGQGVPAFALRTGIASRWRTASHPSPKGHSA